MTTVDRDELLGRVRTALAAVKNPRTGADVLSAEQVRALEMDAEGRVHMQFMLQPEDPGTLVRETRSAVEQVDGVAKVKIDVQLPTAAQQQAPQRRPLQPGSVPAPTPDPNLMVGIDHVVAVSSEIGRAHV